MITPYDRESLLQAAKNLPALPFNGVLLELRGDEKGNLCRDYKIGARLISEVFDASGKMLVQNNRLPPKQLPFKPVSVQQDEAAAAAEKHADALPFHELNRAPDGKHGPENAGLINALIPTLVDQALATATQPAAPVSLENLTEACAAVGNVVDAVDAMVVALRAQMGPSAWAVFCATIERHRA